MVLRVLALVLASTWVQRSGSPGDFASALIRVRVPRALAWSVDATLTMLTSDGVGMRGAGGGGGRGGGRGKGKRPLTFAQIRKGDFGFLRDLLLRSIERAQAMIAHEHPKISPARARDLAVVTGISLAAMGLKMMQVMPGLPVAPGQKNVLLLPFFLLAAKMTKSRFGGLWAGTTVGLISFLLGFGRWGVLELAHFVVPALLADLALPLVRGRALFRLVQLVAIGAVMGVARFTANLLILVLVGNDWKIFVVMSPALATQILFGAFSGPVSLFLLRFDDWLHVSHEPGSGGGGGRGGGGGGGGRGRNRTPSGGEAGNLTGSDLPSKLAKPTT